MLHAASVQFHRFAILAVGAQDFGEVIALVVHQHLHVRHEDQLIAHGGFVGKQTHAREFERLLFGDS